MIDALYIRPIQGLQNLGHTLVSATKRLDLPLKLTKLIEFKKNLRIFLKPLKRHRITEKR